MIVGARVVGRFGEVRPSVARHFDIDEAVVIGGIALDPVFARVPDTLELRELPTQPPVFRDISMALPRDVSARDVERTIRDAGGEYLESVELLDVFEGEQAGEGRRSLAFRLTFRGRLLVVTVTQDHAEYRLLEGETLEVGHHGEPLQIEAGSAASAPIPPAPALVEPTQPPGREPLHRARLRRP